MQGLTQSIVERSEADMLMDDVLALRAAVLDEASGLIERFGGNAASPAIVNLAHYLCLRHHDLRVMQRQLMRHGLSSLGRLESRTLPTIDAVLAALGSLTGRPPPAPMPDEAEFFAGETRLVRATDILFGPEAPHRRGRIMVTLPTEAAEDRALVDDLVRYGMDVARINCAHNDPATWRAMAANVRAAGAAAGRPISVLMDIAGPKIRTGAVAMADGRPRLRIGDAFRLCAEGEPRLDADASYAAGVSLAEMVNRLTVGDRVLYNDSKLEGVVESCGGGEALIRVRRVKAGGLRLKPDKGLNLPDTALGLSPLTGKDQRDLATAIECADMIGYSFVSHPDDIDLLEGMLPKVVAERRSLGLVAKIERPEAVRNLPDLIARASGRRPLGVMIARGDLAAEIGFERLAEMQEQILWVCEAAAVPVIWATQVLENLVRDGTPSRAEMTDAAMAARAECVMLNKGPAICLGVQVLDGLLSRMDEHMFKKTPTLRALKSW